jgi:NADH-quinone oxidoreductase subunit L
MIISMDMVNFNYTIWILILPFLMFLVLGLAGHKLKARLSGLLGTASLAVITVLVVYYGVQLFLRYRKG